MLRCTSEKFNEINLDLHFLFIDFKQAYDSINRTHLYKIVKEFGIPEKLVNLIKRVEDSNGEVKIQGKWTEASGIERGLRPGDALSTTLFNIVLDKVVRNLQTYLDGTIFNRRSQYIAYTDDVLILGYSVRAIVVVVVVTQLKVAVVSTGLVIK